MTGRTQPIFRRRRDLVYGIVLRKVLLAERRTPEEARALRRRRMADGTYPMPADIDPVRRQTAREMA